MRDIKIVCTRLLPPELKLSAGKKGVTVFDSDFLEINYLDNETIRGLIEHAQVPFIFTSVHAIKAVNAVAKMHGLSFKNKICYCIAGPTSELAKESGFQVKAKAENALMLSKEILKRAPDKVVFFTGDIRRKELEEILTENKIEIKVEVVYEKKLLPKKVGSYDGVMFFSPSQVDAFLMQNTLPPASPAFCIGSTTGNYLTRKEHKNIIIATKSNSAAVWEQVYNYFNIKSNDE